MMPFKKNLPAAGSGFSDYYVPEEKFLGPPSPKNLATPLLGGFTKGGGGGRLKTMFCVNILSRFMMNNTSKLGRVIT